MSTFFEDENCNTVIWDSFKIDLCWSLKLSDPQNKKFKEPLFSDMPLSNDTIIVTVKCNEHVDKEIEFEIVELIDGIATPKSRIIYSGKVKTNDDKGTEVDLKKAEGNKIYIIREKPKKGVEENFKCYDNPIKVGKEVLKGIYLFYSDWNNVTFEDFRFDEDAIKRRANEYIEIRMKTEGGRNGITKEQLPENIQQQLLDKDIVKNGIKALVEDERIFKVFGTSLPLYIDINVHDRIRYYRVFAAAIERKGEIYFSDNLEPEADIEKVIVAGNEKPKSLNSRDLQPRGIGNRKKDDDFVKSGLFAYLYNFKDDANSYFDKKEEIDKNKVKDEKEDSLNKLNEELKKRRIVLSNEELINSLGAHEETHLFQGKRQNELTAYSIELISIMEYKNSNG